jgi:UDP-N-acetylmuramate--alanine ligase
MILDKLTISKKQLCSMNELVEVLRKRDDLEILVSFGAGDIDTLVKPIKEMLKAEKK